MALHPCKAVCILTYMCHEVAKTTFVIFIFPMQQQVGETALAAALVSFAAEGVTATSTDTDPTEELRAIPGIDESSLESFAADAAEAAEATAAARPGAAATAVVEPMLFPLPSPRMSPPLHPPRLPRNFLSSKRLSRK